MPPRVRRSLRSSSMWRAASFFGMRSKSPFARRASSCSRRPSRFLIVMKFVSMPPSQRWLTYGWPARSASWEIGSWACFFVPTKRTASPRAGRLADGGEGDVEPLDGLGEVDDVDPVALREDERAHLGIPAASLVAEMDAGLEKLPHGDGGHAWSSCSVRSSAGPDPDRAARASCSAPRHRPGSVAAPRVSSSPRRGDGGCPNGRQPGGVYHRGPASPTSPIPRWWRSRSRPGVAAGSTATRSRRSGRPGSRRAIRQRPARRQPGRPAAQPARACGRRRSPRAGRRPASAASAPRRSTSAGGGPGSTATMSSSRRPTRTAARGSASRPPRGPRRRRPPPRRRRAGPPSASSRPAMLPQATGSSAIRATRRTGERSPRLHPARSPRRPARPRQTRGRSRAARPPRWRGAS